MWFGNALQSSKSEGLDNKIIWEFHSLIKFKFMRTLNGKKMIGLTVIGMRYLLQKEEYTLNCPCKKIKLQFSSNRQSLKL